MEFTASPLDCQINMISCYPLYRTLCKQYNECYLYIFYQKYAYLPISDKELKKYIEEKKPSNYTIVYYNKIVRASIGYLNNEKKYSYIEKDIHLLPNYFDYIYTNKIETYEWKSWREDYMPLRDYKYLDEVTTINILKNRKNCLHPNFVNQYIQKHTYFPQDNDLDVLLVMIRDQIIKNNLDVNVQMSFLHKNILYKDQHKYNRAISKLNKM